MFLVKGKVVLNFVCEIFCFEELNNFEVLNIPSIFIVIVFFLCGRQRFFLIFPYTLTTGVFLVKLDKGCKLDVDMSDAAVG